MSSQAKVYYTPDEYLALERKAEYKSEYLDGEIFAMTGASRRHNLVAGNIFASLHLQLRKRPCEIYPSDMRAKGSPTGLYTYPDAAVVSGARLVGREMRATFRNTAIPGRVPSTSTAGCNPGGTVLSDRMM